MNDDPMPTWAAAMQSALADLRRDVLARLTSLEDRVDLHAAELQVNRAGARLAEYAAGDAEAAVREHQASTAKRFRGPGETHAAMQARIALLQSDIRKLHGEAG